MEGFRFETIVQAFPREVSRRVMLGRVGGGGLAAAGAALLAGPGAVVARQEEDDASAAELLALGSAIVDALNTGDVDALDAVVAEDVEGNVPLPLPGRGRGLEGVKENVLALRAAFPDAEFVVEDLVAAGDKFAVRGVLRGTHEGEFLGVPASGEEVEVSGISFVRIADGKAVEYWIEFDVYGALQQVGAIPVVEGLVLPAAAQASPAAGAAVTLDELIDLPGVVLAIEFEADGALVDSRSRLELPAEEIERAARYSAAATTALAAGAGAYTELTGLEWDPPRWALYSGGEWTTAIAGSRAIIARTDQIAFDELFAALVGER